MGFGEPVTVQCRWSCCTGRKEPHIRQDEVQRVQPQPPVEDHSACVRVRGGALVLWAGTGYGKN